MNRTKNIASILGILLCLLLTLGFIACNRGNATQSNTDNQTGQSAEDQGTSGDSASSETSTNYDPFPAENRITAKEVLTLLQSEDVPTVIDMRDTALYKENSIAEAFSLPLKQMYSRIHEIPRDKVIVLIFENTQGANEAWAVLIEQGYDPSMIRIMDDNLKGWINAGYGISESLEAGC